MNYFCNIVAKIARELMRPGTTRRYTARLLLVLWGLITLNGAVFRHAHRLPDGRIIVHAHPYKLTNQPGPTPYNPHTKAELVWLDVCANAPFVGTEPLTVAFDTPTVFPAQVSFCYAASRTVQSVVIPSLRGPPIRLA